MMTHSNGDDHDDTDDGPEPGQMIVVATDNGNKAEADK
jgi:hypothetical protein